MYLSLSSSFLGLLFRSDSGINSLPSLSNMFIYTRIFVAYFGIVFCNLHQNIHLFVEKPNE